MKKGLRMAIAVIALFSTGIPAAESQAEEISNRDFQYRTQTQVSLANNEPFFILELSPSVYSTMQAGLRDVRFYADTYELGYVRIPAETGPAEIKQETQLKLLNAGKFENGTYGFGMELPVDFKQDPALDWSVKVTFAQEPYLVKGTLYGSPDNRQWQNLKSITLYQIENRTSEISLSGIDYRFLKMEIQPPPNENPVVKSALLVSRTKQQSADSAVREQPLFQVTRDEQQKETLVTADLQLQNRLTSEFNVITQERGFNRQVRLEGSQDQIKWVPIRSSYLYRGTDAKDEKLSLSYLPAEFRYLRLHILDRDNEPIRVEGVQVRTHPVRLLVKTPPNQADSFTLTAYWGNDRLQAPAYDIEQFVGKQKPKQAVLLNSVAVNPNFNPSHSIPLTERFPWLLPTSLVAAALFVGYVLYRNVKQMNK